MAERRRSDGTARVSSVLELSKWPVSTVLYRVVLRPIGIAEINISPGEEWMQDVHPKILFERGYAVKGWKFRSGLPKLCAIDFQYVTELLTSDPIVERFVVQGIIRSHDTGEFYYRNEGDDWMPESTLFISSEAAKREKLRIKKLFQIWAARTSTDEA